MKWKYDKYDSCDCWFSAKSPIHMRIILIYPYAYTIPSSLFCTARTWTPDQLRVTFPLVGIRSARTSRPTVWGALDAGLESNRSHDLIDLSKTFRVFSQYAYWLPVLYFPALSIDPRFGIIWRRLHVCNEQINHGCTVKMDLQQLEFEKTYTTAKNVKTSGFLTLKIVGKILETTIAQ